MAGAKKKKKPAANPARGFATTSVASKPRPEGTDTTVLTSSDQDAAKASVVAVSDSTTNDKKPTASAGGETKTMSPEEYEKHLEESELQILVDKHAQKVKRDAQRQKNRLDTDRRLLRSQAELVNIPKWLPQELIDQILHLVEAESRFASSGVSSEHPGNAKMPSEEDMIIRLWTLQLTLTAIGFSTDRTQATIKHITDITSHISSTYKESIWGLDEALDWLARECELTELPPYEVKGKTSAKGITL